jgi:Ser/Thr protein kinase RdoA (MazF antagonist)
MKHRFRPLHLQAQGRLMARLHNFAVRWQPPAGLAKRKFDWDRLFRNDVGSGMPNAEAWALLSPVHREAFAFVAERVREVMDDWGQDSDVYGLIHGDLSVDANLLFWHGEARAIDFDDSGFGYWISDLAAALEACWEDAAFPLYRESLLSGMPSPGHYRASRRSNWSCFWPRCKFTGISGLPGERISTRACARSMMIGSPARRSS